jgi:hypothetical protein
MMYFNPASSESPFAVVSGFIRILTSSNRACCQENPTMG